MREYRALDTDSERVLVHRLVEGRYRTALDDHRNVRSDVIDGFVPDGSDLFASVRKRSEPGGKT